MFRVETSMGSGRGGLFQGEIDRAQRAGGPPCSISRFWAFNLQDRLQAQGSEGRTHPGLERPCRFLLLSTVAVNTARPGPQPSHGRAIRCVAGRSPAGRVSFPRPCWIMLYRQRRTAQPSASVRTMSFYDQTQPSSVFSPGPQHPHSGTYKMLSLRRANFPKQSIQLGETCRIPHIMTNFLKSS